MQQSIRIIIVDDDPANTEYVARVLSNYNTVCFEFPKEAFSFCRDNPFDIIVADQKMPGMSGIELVKELREIHKDFLALIISAYTETDDLIDAVNSNIIYKYIVKPFSPEFLLQQAHRAEEHLRVRREKMRLEEMLKQTNTRLLAENRKLKDDTSGLLNVFVGFHPSIERIKDLCRIYSRSNEAVLIQGETGTGKELLARAIHNLSPRCPNPFMAINCSALPDTLLESELFGYEKGAFTGADKRKFGLFSAVDGGTLFLDEIGDLPQKSQSKILRVLQFGTFYPIGSREEIEVDVRIISATNKDMMQEVSTGSFRKDLFYRINPLTIEIPPLRERKSDIFPLLDHIIVQKTVYLPPFTNKAKNLLQSYHFPGNVRELESIAEKLFLFTQAHGVSTISEELVSEIIEFGPDRSCENIENDLPNPEENQGPVDLQKYLEKIEYNIVKRYFAFTNRNISETARLLNLSRQGLKNKLKKYDLYIE